MKLLMIIDNMNLGGAQKMFAFLANHFSELGYSVHLLSYASGLSFFPLSSAVGFIGGSKYEGSRTIRHFRKIPFIRSQIKQIKPDIIIAFSTIPAVLSKIASYGMGIPVVFCERGDPYQYKTILEKAKLKTVMICDYSVFQTEAARNYYPKRMREHSSVIPNPVTMQRVERVSYTDRNKNIAFVGRFEIHQKRQDLMIDAFDIVVKKYSGVKLVFYGDGDDYQKAREIVAIKHLEDNVVFRGKVQDVKSEIIDCLMFVLSSDYEGIPNSLIEAMSLGIPCISTDCSPGGARMLIDNNKNGLLVPCGSAMELADAMVYIIEHPQLADEMGINAQRIINDYAPERIVSMWIQMIDKVVKQC